MSIVEFVIQCAIIRCGDKGHGEGGSGGSTANSGH